MDKIIKIAKKYKLKIIEDAAQATGAYYKGRHAGTFGKISAFSTHPLKNLNALGDGGFIITNEKKLYDKIKLYRSHGLEGRDDAKIIGVNSRLDSLNAEVLSFRLKKLNNIIHRRKKNINYYKKYIKTDKVKILNDGKNEKNAYVMFVTLAENRNKLQEYLKRFNIQSLLYYPTPLHLHNSMKYLGYKKGNLINAERITSKVISFPHHQHLTEKQIKFVSEKINKFYL
jgi:dTDP-4-amino-4,6-dideoxygalactose transaminase